jgi:hypothetical protein
VGSVTQALAEVASIRAVYVTTPVCTSSDWLYVYVPTGQSMHAVAPHALL